MLIPVDHGNRNMKTVHHVFTSGLIENPHMIVADNDVIELGGMTYSLSNERLLYKRDKTVNDDYFVLTLFAIGKELGTAAQQGTDIFPMIFNWQSAFHPPTIKASVKNSKPT